MDKNAKIFVAGHTGLFGVATVQYLKKYGYNNLVLKTHRELDLTRQSDTRDFFMLEKPEYVFVMAGKVGGIKANNEKMAEFTMENLKMTTNIIDSAHESRVNKLLYLGSSCIYPPDSPQPIKEEFVLTGSIEPTNEGYALAKIIGIKMCEYYKKQYGDNFISCIPANVYGPNDKFDGENNHVVPALIRKIHDAKTKNASQVEIWGSGKPKREFLYIKDAVDACIFLMNNYDGEKVVNVGVGVSTSIRKLAEKIAKIEEYRGNIIFDTTKPDGMMERMLDSSKINLMGWNSETKLEDGIEETYKWFVENRRHS